ncbi:PREDICTED: uncharacterized protein LOC106931720 isoform X2 [Poecilia mexicana]|uniref:uncharacterized protein LOC106931720 isoform X2 n=1 Tax=Poecilia mexicana TaxID=48701 RepID=UPI00072D9C84|nr:PREDICTED: uncharacterized protein LOC106931720 isoform X2 [Poecilia mexicana]
MQQVVWISVVLLNVVWISFFLTPDLDFSVFVQRRSISSSDETFMMEFCLQSDSDRKWTSAGPSVSGPDGDISTVTERPVNRKKTQHGESNSGDKFPTSAAPDADPDEIDLNGPTVSTDEQRLTSPPEFSSSSEADPVTKIPTTTRNQKVTINRPRQHKITLSPLRPGPGMNGTKTQTPKSSPDDKFPTSAAPDPDEILAEPTVSVHEQRLTSPAGLNSSPNLITKIQTTPRNQRMDISRPVQQELLPTVRQMSLAFPDDCCFVLMKGPVNEKLIASFEVTDSCCPMNAAILITKKAQHLCVDPKEPWVKRIIDFLQTRDLDGPTLSTQSEVSSSPMLRQHSDVNLALKIPTTPRHQKVNTTLSPLGTEPENGTGPIECCFQVCKNPVDIREIASFHMTDPLCPTSAAVLITKTAKHLCADPEEQWVKTIINFLEKKAP